MPIPSGPYTTNTWYRIHTTPDIGVDTNTQDGEHPACPDASRLEQSQGGGRSHHLAHLAIAPRIHHPSQEPDRAAALVNANNKTPAPDSSNKPSSSSTDHHHPAQPHLPGSAAATPCSASPFVSPTASPAKFDKLGRRILTPPNTRTSSAYGSLPGTPRNEVCCSQP